MTPINVFKILAVVALTISFSAEFVSTGDPCPPKSELASCTCSQVSLNRVLGNLISTTTSLPRLGAGEQPEIKGEVIPVKPRKARDVPISTPFPSENTSSFYTEVTCNAPRSLYIIDEVLFNGFNRYCIDKLVVSNLPPMKEQTMINFPRGMLKNVRVKNFEVKNTILSGDFIHAGNPFEGQEQSLVWFAARNCYLSGGLTFDSVGSVNTKGLNLLGRIEGVDLSKNHFTFIHASSFRYPPANLSSVVLSFNSIKGIEPGAFQYVPKLKHVDLSHNLMDTITRGIFASPARELQNINLSWNRLISLPPDFFINMATLRIVNMSNNFLYSMPDKPWAIVWRQLTFINMNGNFLSCDCSLMWLLNILSPPVVNVTTTPAPRLLKGQTVIGACLRTEPEIFTRKYLLAHLTASSLNCEL